MQSAKLDQAVQFATDHETPWTRDITDRWGIHHEDPPPWNKLLGPVHARGPVSGTIVLNGKTLISWGQPDRPDLTFSIAKTYLALVAGVAHDRGLLPDVDEPVRMRIPGIGFDEGPNAQVTWAHLLQQTSEWEGTVFGVPDQADRYRTLSFLGAAAAGKKGDPRPLQAPGTFWEYNDVRINQFSLALLHLFGRPLPDVFREAIMQPVGASDYWRWVGYDNAWITLKGHRVQSVPGGTHWGGGVSIGSHDQARIGQMMLEDGKVNGRQVISPEWIKHMRTPCRIAPFYGYLIWLNHDRRVFPSVPASSYLAIGAGGNFTWIEPERRMVVVVRWINPDNADEFFRRVLQAIGERG
ncbi:MAG TPA: serine hydrolase [Burkholderiales bacterium]|nr:serine hydrolase [Burkholderiales bacterium]